MSAPLTPEEVRIIGCLMEKAVTTPDQYPLTVNALTNACNQKSSRQPVMSLEQVDVQRICRQLKDKNLLRVEENFKKNIEKYDHNFCNSLLGKNQFDPAEYAIICLLLLRGPQTPGELRSRSGRLYSFESNQQVIESLNSLMAIDRGPVVCRLAREPGRKDHEYTHLFAGDIESVPEDTAITLRVPASAKNQHNQQMSRLEIRVAALEKALTEMAGRLGEEIDLVKLAADLTPSDELFIEDDHE
ncbi:MAG: YceH family protein [Oceanicoccus sp.]